MILSLYNLNMSIKNKTGKQNRGGNKTVQNKDYNDYKNRKTIKRMNCSPAVKGKTIKNTSCLTPAILLKIKEEYNKDHPTTKIISKNPIEIWEELNTKLKCQKEECWVNEIDDIQLREQIKKYIFAPKHPKEWITNPDEWLSNYDIFDVAKQYEYSYPNFKIIGPTTIDFDVKLEEKNGKCVLEDLCHFSLEQFIKKKKTKIGIVFNLDKHNEPGSHWVSLFIDIDYKIIFYFDSAGNSVPKEVEILINRILEQGENYKIRKPIYFKVYNNDGIDHQKGNTECGMYSLFFIITMLTGKTPEIKETMSMKRRIDLFLKTRIPDKVVFDYRALYFND